MSAYVISEIEFLTLTASADYLHWFDMARALVARLAAGYEEDVFANNAQRFYRLARKSYL